MNTDVSKDLLSIKQLKYVFPIVFPYVINTVLHRSITFVCCKNSDIDPLLQASKISKLSDLFEYKSAICMYDYLHNSLPESFDNMFVKHNSLTTRQSNWLHIATSRLNFTSILPKFTWSKLWNKLVKHFSEDIPRSSVKQYIKKYMLHNCSAHFTPS